MKQDEDRQSFLGPRFGEATAQAKIAVVGTSGGGSHVLQQLAHAGFVDFALFDPKCMEEKHLHRLVGATRADVDAGTPKVRIGERVIRAIRPDARIVAIEDLWGASPHALRSCDLVFGCVDTFRARHELEVVTRRYLIPYIDIGIDVLPPTAGFGHRLVGQVILSMPGGPCMRCMRFLDDERLNQEAQEYGAAGRAPQVVFANGLLASAAVGIAVDLLSGWSGAPPRPFLRLDGNELRLAPDPCEQRWLGIRCPHFRPEEIGPPRPTDQLAPRRRVDPASGAEARPSIHDQAPQNLRPSPSGPA